MRNATKADVELMVSRLERGLGHMDTAVLLFQSMQSMIESYADTGDDFLELAQMFEGLLKTAANLHPLFVALNELKELKH